MPDSVESQVKMGGSLTENSGVMSLSPRPATFLEIDHEIISMATLPFQLIQWGGQLSVTGKGMCSWYWSSEPTQNKDQCG